jgi:hypothetical protein
VDRKIGRLLRAVCVGDAVNVLPQLRSSTWASPQFVRDTADAAIYHRVVPLLADALKGAPDCEPLLDELMPVYRAETSHVLRLEMLLKRAVTALSEADIATAVFKGPALAHVYYDSPAQRAYVDIDLLITGESLDRANEALESVGIRPSEVEWRKHVDCGYGEVTYFGPDRTLLDLHLHPIREPAIRSAFNWPTSDLLSRAKIAAVEGVDLPVLDPEDMLIAVATHACYDGAYRLGWLLDVARIEQSGRVRWDVLAQRCASSGLGLPVQVVLDRARRTLGYTPESPLALARGPWRAVTTAITSIRPVEHTFGQVARGGVVFRATRRTTSASFGGLATFAVNEVAKPLLADPDHRWKLRPRQRDRAPTRPTA